MSHAPIPGPADLHSTVHRDPQGWGESCMHRTATPPRYTCHGLKYSFNRQSIKPMANTQCYPMLILRLSPTSLIKLGEEAEDRLVGSPCIGMSHSERHLGIACTTLAETVVILTHG